MKTTKKARHIPFWLQIVMILISGVLASLLVFALSNYQKALISERNAPEYTVNFAYQDGTVIEKKAVKKGKGVFPPNFETEGVFRGWSSSINNVTSNLEVHPAVYEINDENLFYFDSVYVKEGEKFTIDLTLAGKVNLSSAELEIEYDPDVMKFIKTSKSEICSVEKIKNGLLKVTINSDEPLTDKLLLSYLTFKAKKKNVNYSRVDLKAKNGTIVENGKEQSATISTINNNIFYLQEVAK